MKAISRRTVIFAVFTFLSEMAGIIILVYSLAEWDIKIKILLLFIASGSGIMACFWIQEYRKLKIAQLIVENQILHISPSVIQSGKQVKTASRAEVFISYFGILLDSKIITFNQRGILLKNVEIGSDFISLTYGTDKLVQNIRLLHTVIARAELNGIVERFRYETGIVPVITA